MLLFIQEMPLRGLYPKAALLSHDCVGNTFISLDETRSLRIYSSVDIDVGKTIYNNYTFSLVLSVSFLPFTKIKSMFSIDNQFVGNGSQKTTSKGRKIFSL